MHTDTGDGSNCADSNNIKSAETSERHSVSEAGIFIIGLVSAAGPDRLDVSLLESKR